MFWPTPQEKKWYFVCFTVLPPAPTALNFHNLWLVLRSTLPSKWEFTSIPINSSEAFRCPENFTSAHVDFSLSVYFIAEIIGSGALSYLQDIKENYTSNQCLFGAFTSGKKEPLPFKPTYLRSSLKAPTGSKVSKIILKSFSSWISYSLPIFFTWPCCLYLHDLTYTISLLKNGFCFSLCSLETCTSSNSPGNLSHKNSHDCLSLYFWPACECTWLWMAPSFPNVCRLYNREIVVLTFFYAPTFCFTKWTYFLGYFIYLEVILPSKITPFSSIMYEAKPREMIEIRCNSIPTLEEVELQQEKQC